MDLKQILSDHAEWLHSDSGVRADLREANLREANLCKANLFEANLCKANLFGAYLFGADLREANLREANLRGADLRGANLRGANLFGADLREANLRGANLREANLRGVDLSGAKLPHFQIPQTGSLTVYKKVGKAIVELRIPEGAKRTATLVGRKCRAEYVEVISISTGVQPIYSSGGCGAEYRVGEIVHPDSYDDDIRIECTHGIHFFLTREEAEEW